MREELDRIARLRGLRVTQRQKEVAAAEAARAETVAQLRRLEGDIAALRGERAGINALSPGQTMTAAGFEARERVARALDGEIRALARKQVVTRRGLAEREKALEAARRQARAAERARDQIERLAERVADAERREAEMREELQEDTPVRRPAPDRGGAP